MARNVITRNLVLSEESRVRGMLVPQRSERNISIKAPNENTVLPFISTVNVKEPLGLRPIQKAVVIQRTKMNNEIVMRNKKNIQELLEKSKQKKGENNNQIFSKSASCKMMKIKKKKGNCHCYDQQECGKDINEGQVPKMNEMIKSQTIEFKDNDTVEKKEIAKEEKIKEKEVVIEVKGNDDKKKEDIEKLKETVNAKETIIAPKEQEVVKKEEVVSNEEKIDLDKFMEELDNEEDNQQEMNNILGYINNLDYDKYSHDLEIREALQLIKNKMEKEREEDRKNHPEKYTEEKTENLTTQQKENQPKKETETDDNDNEKKKLPDIKPLPLTKEEEEKIEEIKKYQLAEKVSKCDPRLRAIHSYKSIRKLLEREGLADMNMIDPLRITLIQERGRVRDDGYISNKLPFLHSLPLV